MSGEQVVTTKPPTVVELERWQGVDPQTGRKGAERWSLLYEGRALVTRGSEAECREVAREYRWKIRDGWG